jgi:hypothetical protein
VLFSADAWPGLADGSITLTFRTWATPQAKAGGRYRVGGMLLEATDVTRVALASITDDDARRAGATDGVSLRTRLADGTPEQLVWRVELAMVGIDDRIERRNADDLTPAEVADILGRLDRLDKRSPSGPWTRSTLRLIERYPGVVSTALARRAQQERPVFKVNVRKLKELGLTESLDVGYRLSPRGEVIVQSLRG